MIAMWIIIGVAGAAAIALLVWRLRKANATLNRILLEEQAHAESESESETLPTSNDR